MTGPDLEGAGVKLAFERQSVVVSLMQIVPLKTLRAGAKDSKKYAQIVGSVRAVGLVEAPVVTPDPKRPGKYFLLDGHLRIEALKDIGITEVECLISTDDETYTYNKRVNRIVPVQEHRMIMRAVERGVPESRIAEALGLEATSVRRRARMLDGICSDAVEMLKDSPCAFAVFDVLRRMAPVRQLEAAELMVGQGNFTAMFAKALLVATPERQLAGPPKKKPEGTSAVTLEQIARMERELASLQNQVKSVEDTYGVDNLHLTVARGYIAKLLANARIVRWLSQRRQEYLTEFQSIAEVETIAGRK
jgi:hypothetical protein